MFVWFDVVVWYAKYFRIHVVHGFALLQLLVVVCYLGLLLYCLFVLFVVLVFPVFLGSQLSCCFLAV